MLQVCNITVTCKLPSIGQNRKIDLNELQKAFSMSIYNPKKFKALIVKWDRDGDLPKFTALIFSNCKCVIVGVKNVSDAKKACNTIADKVYVHLLNKNDDDDDNHHDKHEKNYNDFEIRNIVCSGDVNQKICLHSFYKANKAFCLFDQETFSPGLYYRPTTNKMLAIIFYNGKIIITGSNSLEKSIELYDLLRKKLLRHKK